MLPQVFAAEAEHDDDFDFNFLVVKTQPRAFDERLGALALELADNMVPSGRELSDSS